MLGSAQCGRCGAPLIGGGPVGAAGTATPAPVPAPPPPPPPRGTGDLGSPSGFAPPPPPPSGWTPTASTRAGRRAAAAVNGSPAAKTGCGCAAPLGLLALGVGAVAVFGGSNLIEGISDGDGIQDEGTLVLGVPARGGIGSGDTDRWRLAGEDGDFTIEVHAVGDFDPVVEARVVSGRHLGRDDDGGETGRDSRLEVQLEAGEQYEVDVTGFGSSSGDYEIVVSPVTPPAPPPPPVDGGTLGVRTPVDGVVAPGGSVRYRFSGEGREVVISVRGHDGFDPTVRVLDEGGQQLGFDDDGGIDRGSLLAVTVPGGTTVTVEVAGFNGGAGRYTVEVE